MQTKQSIDEHAARNFIWSRKKARARSSFTTFASLDEIGNYLRARTDTCSALIHSNDSPSFIHSSFWCFFCSILSLSRTFQCWLLLMEFLFCLIRLPCYMAIEPWDNVQNDLDYKLDNSIKIGIQSMANDHCLIHSLSHHNTRNGPFIVCVCP